jgi:two-component system, chemotaxis family, protein-glutamate methylesterase/glutaminase
MKPIKILIVEDSPTVCVYLGLVFAKYEDIEIIGVAKNGREGISLTQSLRPDLVLMDLHMPELDGFSATREIMQSCPTPIIIITATGDPKDKFLSIKALECGAVGLLAKPVGLEHRNSTKQIHELINHIRALVEVKTVRLRAMRNSRNNLKQNYHDSFSYSVVAIATSTGGPQALGSLLAKLDTSFPAPILLVQHIAPDFADGFAQWLQSVTKLKVIIARDGDLVTNGRVYLSSNNYHIGINHDGRISLSDAPSIGGFKPSANYLFESVGNAFGKNSLAIILTGMGSDGQSGLKRLKQAGGHVIAQDESSSVVFGMPKAAIDAGLVDEVLSLDSITARLYQFQDLCEK